MELKNHRKSTLVRRRTHRKTTQGGSGLWAFRVMGLRGSVGLRRKYPGVAGNHPEIAGKLVLEGRVSRVMGHWVTGCTTFAHIWVTGSPEIASPAFSGLVGATLLHRRHPPEDRGPISLSISDSPSLPTFPFYSVSHTLNRSALSVSSLCSQLSL
jgi:hypothetical protein